MLNHCIARHQNLSPDQFRLLTYLVHNLPHHHLGIHENVPLVLPEYFRDSFFNAVYLGSSLYLKLADGRILDLNTHDHVDTPDRWFLSLPLDASGFKLLAARLDEIAQDPKMIRHQLLKKCEVPAAEYLRVWELREFYKNGSHVTDGVMFHSVREGSGWNHLYFAVDPEKGMFEGKTGSNFFVLSFQPEARILHVDAKFKAVFSKMADGGTVIDIANGVLIPLEGEELEKAHARWKTILRHVDTQFERGGRCSLR